MWLSDCIPVLRRLTSTASDFRCRLVYRRHCAGLAWRDGRFDFGQPDFSEFRLISLNSVPGARTFFDEPSRIARSYRRVPYLRLSVAFLRGSLTDSALAFEEGIQKIRPVQASLQ
jgi:hypothetical protein